MMRKLGRVALGCAIIMLAWPYFVMFDAIRRVSGWRQE